MTPERIQELKRLFDAESEKLRGLLESLTSHESPSDQASLVSHLSQWIVSWLLGRGLDARAVPCPPAGDSVLVHWGAPGGKLLVGHIDTVWPAGTLEEFPFSVTPERIGGPGVFDMKAGLAVLLCVCEAVSQGKVHPSSGFSIFLTSDEETGTTASREALLKTAREHSCALVLEPCADGGAAKIARKAIGTVKVDFFGVSAHAGLAPEKGASALLEMSRYALYSSSLSDALQGTTVSPAVAHAGDRNNVIPERADLVIDFRAWTAAEADRILSLLAAYQPTDERVSVLLSGGLSRPAMQPSPGSLAMYETVRSLAALIGFSIPQARVGGGSDGNFIAALGVPTLDGLGPSGGGAHARSEHVLIEDLTRRAALLASLLEEEPWPLGC